MNHNLTDWRKITRWYTYRTTCNSTSDDQGNRRIASNICLDSILLTNGLAKMFLMSTTLNINKKRIGWRKIAKNLRRYTYKIAYNKMLMDLEG